MSEIGLGCEPCWQGVAHFYRKVTDPLTPRVEGLSDQTGARVALSGARASGRLQHPRQCDEALPVEGDRLQIAARPTANGRKRSPPALTKWMPASLAGACF
jgi:hypothetical protein